MENSHDVAVLIGRFQPFHNGHALLLARALASAPRVVVLLGSSFHARNPKNPFTWQERAAMIAATLSEPDRQRVLFSPVRDYYNSQRWAAAVLEAVAAHTGADDKIGLVGYFKDSSSEYLNWFPRWELDTVAPSLDIDATRIRQVLFEADDIDISLSVLDGQLPVAVRHYLRAWTLLGHYPPLVEEHAMVRAYQASWRAAPFPPVFVTVDAVVKTAGQVLLIQRKGFPGRGQWALPGGFLDPHERLLDAAVRELREETGLGLLASSLAAVLADVKVFDHPYRSQRGRTITHAHLFELRMEQLPEVHGSDDAADAKWVPVDQLAAMEEQFYEDHFHILDEFLGLTA